MNSALVGQVPISATARGAITVRIERLPACGALRRTVLLIAIGGWFEFYELFMPAGISSGLTHDGIYTLNATGLFDLGSFPCFLASFFLGISGWHWVMLIGALGGLIVWFIQRGIPGSPQWLRVRGGLAEAVAAMPQLEHCIECETGPLPAPVEVREPAAQIGWLSELWNHQYSPGVFAMSVFQFCQTVAVCGFTSWVPAILGAGRQIGGFVMISAAMLAIIVRLGHPGLANNGRTLEQVAQ